MRMRFKLRRTATATAAIALVAAGASLAVPGAARAAGAAPGTQVTGTLANGTGWIAEYPANWNGTLILYSHGFGPLTAADAPDPNTQAALLADALLELDEQGFGGRRTVVLSPRDDDQCCAHGLAGNPWTERLAPLLVAGATADLDVVELCPSATRYCAISRFQGLEAPAVVLTDVADLDSAAACSALYVGCTRALERLVILAHESLKAKLEPIA